MCCRMCLNQFIPRIALFAKSMVVLFVECSRMSFKALCYVLAISCTNWFWFFCVIFNRRDLKPKLHGAVFVPKTVLNYLPVARL